MSEWVGHIRREGDVWVGQLQLGDMDWPLLLRGTVEKIGDRTQLRIVGKMAPPPKWMTVPILDREEPRR